MVVVLADTNDMCMIRNPNTLNANARFRTATVRHHLLHKSADVIYCIGQNDRLKRPYQRQEKWLQGFPVFQEFHLH